MASVTLDANIICKNGSAARWAQENPILLKGQMGVEIDTGKFKFGDGATHYNTLAYASGLLAVVKTTEPTISDSDYDIGQVWVSTTTNKSYMLIDNTANTAIWKMNVTATDYATTSSAGVVKSSVDEDKIKVEPDGTMSVNSVNPSKISGAVAAANKLATPRKIELSGDVTAAGVNFDGSSNITLSTSLASVIAAGTGCKVTVNSKGMVTEISALSEEDIPNLPSTKITGLGSAAGKDTGLAAGNVVVVAADGKIDSSIMPAIAITDTFEVADEAEMLALNAQKGDVAVRSDLNKTYILKQGPADVVDNWTEMKTPTDSVISVNGKTGAVALTTSNVAEGDNLYYTDARATSNFNVNFGLKSSLDLTDGAAILRSTDTLVLDGGSI